MKTKTTSSFLTVATSQHPLETLRARFEEHMHRHQGVAWNDVLSRLEASSVALSALAKMEASGGEPDVVGRGFRAQLRV